MKIHLLLFTILLFPQLSNGQSEVNSDQLEYQPIEPTSRFSIGISYSPEASYRFLGIREGEDVATMQSIIDSRNESETFKYGQTAGILFNYRVSDRFALESGIGYTMYGEKTKPIDLILPDLTFYGTLITSDSYHYVSVPISLEYAFGQKRLKYVVSSGVSASFMAGTSSSSKLNFAEGGVSTSSSINFGPPDIFNHVVLGAHLAAGIQCHFPYTFSRFSVRLTPVFRITAKSVTYAPILGYYFNTGIETSIRWRL